MNSDRLDGTIAEIQWDLLVTAFWLMMLVVVPVIVLTLAFAWRYRAGNTAAAYRPDWDTSRGVELAIWAVPIALIMVLGAMVWSSTHRLDPYRPIASDLPATRIQAVAYDWKWLFIYPDLGIATVNEMAFPQDRPFALQITSEVAMNSFMIPELGGQIYAMAGMETQMHLWSDKTGAFEGRNMQYSGDGFSDQRFTAMALTPDAFETWVTKVRAAPQTWSAATRAALRAPSVSAPVSYFKDVPPDLFGAILRSYAHCHADGAPPCR